MGSTLLALCVPVLALATAAWLTRAFAHSGSRLNILDHPNERSLHSHPTPLTGGVAIVAGIIAGALALILLLDAATLREPAWLGVLVLAVALVSYLDDRRHLPVVYRMTAHLVAANLVLYGGWLSRRYVCRVMNGPWPDGRWRWSPFFTLSG